MYDLRSTSLAAFADVVVMQISIAADAQAPPQAPLPPPLPREEFVKKYVAYMRKKQKKKHSSSSGSYKHV